MAVAQARVSGHGLCVPIARALTTGERSRLRAQVRKLLEWQLRLRDWPAPSAAPDATPFVSVYADGVLRGCFGSHEGGPGERLTRAFLRALEDSRYGTVRAPERERLVVVVSYVNGIRRIDPERVHEQLAAGVEGLGVTRDGMPPVLLLPEVARDQRAGPRELLAILARKCGLADWRGASLFAVRTDGTVVRPGRQPPPSRLSPRAAAASWLARLVGPDGAIAFGIDGRKRRRLETGPMHHGRAASVVRALDEHGGHRAAARRARVWLEREIHQALSGTPVQGWPQDVPMVAGTLALARMAGLDVTQPLVQMAGVESVRSSAWHAAQVVTALGKDAPDSLWRACTDHLATQPWAPWTVLAARARGEMETARTAARALSASIRTGSPHKGGCGSVEVPETALTALVVEALAGLPDADARRAVVRGRAFLRGLQLVGDAMPAQLDPDLAHGAFPASPVVVDLLRGDVVGHAFSALRGGEG
jgi:AMMECR1 domain-containing protein